MTGPKTNERPGTRAKATHVRVSAYKAREILNAIRGMHVADAADYLDLSERGVADVVSKVLDSAVANAEHNDLQDADELYVSACYADEGPTMKRWRPRARGRATRIRKRTCHITVIVSRLDDDKIEVRREKVARQGSGRSASADRAARVAKSRGDEEDTSTEAAAAEAEEVEELEEGAEAAADAPQDAVEDAVEAEETPQDEVAEDTADDAEEAAEDSDASAESTESGDSSGAVSAGKWDGSHAPLADVGEAPDGFPIKGNEDSMKFHQPGGRWFDNTVAEVWFATPEAAEAAGFTEAGKKAKSTSEEEE